MSCGHFHPTTIGATCQLGADHTTDHEAEVFVGDDETPKLIQWKREVCGAPTASFNGRGTEALCSRNALHDGEHRP